MEAGEEGIGIETGIVVFPIWFSVVGGLVVAVLDDPIRRREREEIRGECGAEEGDEMRVSDNLLAKADILYKLLLFESCSRSQSQILLK